MIAKFLLVKGNNDQIIKSRHSRLVCTKTYEAIIIKCYNFRHPFESIVCVIESLCTAEHKDTLSAMRNDNDEILSNDVVAFLCCNDTGLY